MEFLDYVKAFWTVPFFRILPESSRRKTIERRKCRIVRYAKNHSAYYADTSLQFENVTPVTKKEVFEHFDEIITNKKDPDLNFKRILDCVATGKEVFPDGKFILSLTSGTTGNPSAFVMDSSFSAFDSLASAFRGIEFNLPVATLTNTKSYAVSNQRLIHNKKKIPFMKNKAIALNSFDNPETNLRKIENLKIKTIVGFTNDICQIAEFAERTDSHNKVKLVICSGEAISETERQIIQRCFPLAKIKVAYGCTEGGAMAYECRCGHMHINDDLVLLEPVDKNLKPIGYDIESDSVLLTCFYNKVMPIIRYSLGDRVTLHRGSDCPCGCKSDWIEVRGRTFDSLFFHTPEGTTEISPTKIKYSIENINKEGLVGFRDFRIIQHGNNKLEVRLLFLDEVDRDAIFEEVKKNLTELFASNHVFDLDIYLSDEPIVYGHGKKGRQIFKAD